MKFIDLFAGLGGFHVALSSLGHKCVFASEINRTLAENYERNFNIKVAGDIRKIEVNKIPKHDILCAGFPCQPFSKAGRQKGLKDRRNGDYFINDVARILKYHKPKYFILENVSHLKKHDRERTWKIILKKLNDLNYDVKDAVLSPHKFGIPQIRKRIFIVGSLKDLNGFRFPEPKVSNELDIKSILDKAGKSDKKLSQRHIDALNLWQKIISSIPKDDPLPSFPIWSMEFGATYPFKEKTPFICSVAELNNCKGIFGKSLKNLNKSTINDYLPSYAKSNDKKFPKWKINYIKQNREFYEKYKNVLKPFLKELRKLSPSWQKLEWNCNGEKRVIKDYILQFRASGIRVKRTNYAPSLVLTTTQRPIIGWEERYISPKEAARLQALESIKLPKNETTAIRALGNAVNSKLVKLVASNLLK
jgi:DNA (cytosine-5)-methyltransferase 1